LSNGLDKLIYIYSVDTSSFYNDIEHALDKELITTKQYKANLAEITKPLNKFKVESNKLLKQNNSQENIGKLSGLEDGLIEFIKRNEPFKEQINEYLIYDDINSQYQINNKSTLYLSEQYLNKRIRELKNQ
jgi:hypothetical protein